MLQIQNHWNQLEGSGSAMVPSHNFICNEVKRTSSFLSHDSVVSVSHHNRVWFKTSAASLQDTHQIEQKHSLWSEKRGYWNQCFRIGHDEKSVAEKQIPILPTVTELSNQPKHLDQNVLCPLAVRRFVYYHSHSHARQRGLFWKQCDIIRSTIPCP